MKRLSVTAFDDRVEIPQGGSTATEFSSVEIATVLGMFDQIAYVVTAEQISGSNPTVGVKLSHSADGRNWLEKPGQASIPDDYVLNPYGQNVLIGFDDGIIPSLRLVRFVITVGGTGPVNVAVRIDATLNDTREGSFARKMRKELVKQGNANQCSAVIQGGSHIAGNFQMAQTLGAAADSSGLANGQGPLAGILTPDGHGGFYVAADARLCEGLDDKTLTLSNTTTQLQIAPVEAGGSDSASGSGSPC